MYCPQDHTLYGTGYDVRDYYHAIRMPSWLSSHFGLPSISLEVLKLAASRMEVELPCFGDDVLLVRPALASLPMVWKWAVVLAQAVHEQIASLHISSSRVLADRHRFSGFSAPEFDAPAMLAYIDDGSLMSTNAAAAQRIHDEMAKSWVAKGFELHAEKGHDACDHWEKIGISIDGRKVM
jgi:hypothetical protein